MKLMFTLATGLLVGCATVEPPNPISARLYNLENGTVINASAYDVWKGYGKIVSRLNSGEVLKGEFSLSEDKNDYRRIGDSLPNRDNKKTFAKNRPLWAEVYGFEPGSNVRPNGTGILVGDKGTVISLVFFSFVIRGPYTMELPHWGIFADGVGKSKKGEWYRIYIGNIESSNESVKASEVTNKQ